MSLDSFFEEDNIEKEKQRRICVALWAYIYEKYPRDCKVSDAKFDRTSRLIDLSIKTGNKLLDEFFETKFHPDTGQWVLEHPELYKLENLYRRLERDDTLPS